MSNGNDSQGLEKRVEGLERTLFRVGAIATAVSIALAVSVGLTWKQIPERTAKAMENESVVQAERLAEAAAKRAVQYAEDAELAAKRASFNLCQNPAEQCRCASDSSGDYEGYVVVCVSQCEDGRLSDFQVREMRVGASNYDCPKNL